MKMARVGISLFLIAQPVDGLEINMELDDAVLTGIFN